MGYYEFYIECSHPFKEALIALLGDSDVLGIVDKERALVCYYLDTKGIDSLLCLFQGIQKTLAEQTGIEKLRFNYTYLSEKDWNESWKKRFIPIDVGEEITILPPWEDKKEGRINILIDPGMAFGTGHHETTRRCLELILQYAKQTEKGSFLDLGTGTGILAIFASLIGFKDVYALDNDPLAIDAACRNSSLNQTDNIRLTLSDVSEAEGLFDMIAANLLLNVLTQNSGKIAELLKPKGIAILSGLIQGQEQELLPLLNRERLRPLLISPYDNWATLIMTKD